MTNYEKRRNMTVDEMAECIYEYEPIMDEICREHDECPHSEAEQEKNTALNVLKGGF